MLKEIFYDNFKISKVTRVCMKNRLRVTGRQELFLIQILLSLRRMPQQDKKKTILWPTKYVSSDMASY